MPCALSYPTCLVFCVLSCPTCSRVPCASYHTCSRVSRASCPIRYCASRALCPMWPRALHFMSPFSLITVLSCTLHILWPNITFCVLEFLRITLLFFWSFATYDFLGEFTKVKQTKYENIYIWNCKLFWYMWRWIWSSVQ